MTRSTHMGLAAIAGVALLAVTPGTASADNYAQYKYRVNAERLWSALPWHWGDWDTERANIAIAQADFDTQQRAHENAIKGQAWIGGSQPAVYVTPGTTVMLTFSFADTTTNLPATGPSVAWVHYWGNFDPSTPNTYVDLGTSSDSASNFSKVFTASLFEPLIEAVPYDALGNEIVIAGVDGYNIARGFAVALPSPSSVALFAVGGLAWTRRRR